MKLSVWYGLAVAGLLAGPLRASAQSLAGTWQGVEAEKGDPRYWPAVLRVQAGKGTALFGVLYQEVGGQPEVSVTFQMQGTRTGTRLRLDHVRKLNETGGSPLSYWCDGSIAFTYDPALEKLTGHATYDPVNDCDTGDFTLYRVRLKSAATVPAGAATNLRVSGRDVHWFADAELKQPVATGNIYRTKLSKATTFYITQGYYPSVESAAVPITIQVSGAKPGRPARPAPPVVSVPPVVPTPPDTLKDPLTSAPVISAAPVVLPTVLFKLGKPELLPEASPALDQLAAALRARPALRLRIAGHTDRVGESDKNQVLSEQRAAAVKAYLVRVGIAADRLETVGYGDTRPLYPSPDARNRRVEVSQL
ncbi:OmpA family protein [Hymenobacter psoromatis]|uniref:OmpA family protein n=1 Tax=Hymenobacter psoromatis TaxID=1484116 RepID=UPI001CBF87FB|nr:OmpA family protein [Hymenobacter psoromatis]